MQGEDGDTRAQSAEHSVQILNLGVNQKMIWYFWVTAYKMNRKMHYGEHVELKYRIEKRKCSLELWSSNIFAHIIFPKRILK